MANAAPSAGDGPLKPTLHSSLPSPTRPSRPIAISIPRPRGRQPTPVASLTAREEKTFYFPPPEALVSESHGPRPANDIILVSDTPPSSHEQPSPPPTLAISPRVLPSSMASSVGATAVSPLKSRDNNSLKLSNLPRYHPANFPTSGVAPAAPHAQHQQSPRHSSETQKRLLHLYQRDLINNAILAPRNPGGDHRPNSPQLAPLGSPGPVTPLVLEDEAVGYLASGPSSAGQSDRRNEQAALVDSLLHEESPRRRDSRGDGLAATDTRP